MPGFTIHIAIAKEYIEKHPEEIKQEKEFIQGVIDPDLLSIEKHISKEITHYETPKKGKLEIDLEKFIQNKPKDCSVDYEKGYFLHLLTDSLFYTKDFKKETQDMKAKGEDFYYDYDVLNESLMKRYQVNALPTIQKYMGKLDGKPKYLQEEKIVQFIERVASCDLEKERKER